MSGSAHRASFSHVCVCASSAPVFLPEGFDVEGDQGFVTKFVGMSGRDRSPLPC